MKKIFYLLSIFICSSLWAIETPTGQIAAKVLQLQNEKTDFQSVSILSKTNVDAKEADQISRIAPNANFLNFSADDATQFLKLAPKYCKMMLPIGNQEKEILLYESEIFTPDFFVTTSESNDQAIEYNGGKHYRGIINGDANSLVAISVFENEVMGIVSTSEGNYVIGKLADSETGIHIIYNDKEMLVRPNTECGTLDDNESSFDPENNSMEKSLKCVRFYWEVDYAIFLNKGSVVNATNYVTGLFNQSAIIYGNDGISVTLSSVFVWSTASPYTASTTSGLLSQFQSTRNSFNGDLGHLLGSSGGGGVAAGFSGLCASNLDNSQCYSEIYNTYENVPTFSWSVYVVTHEQGHLLGSRHTHACVWNGNNTAIDNCGPSAGYGYEGSCSNAPTPIGGGTIMSYCHLTSGGVNFNLGFGTQPKTLILNNVEAGSCLTSCGGGGGCSDAFEPNNSISTAASISTNAAITAQIATSSDLDYYAFSISNASDLNITLTNLPADYDMSLYNGSGTLLASSALGGTSSETIALASAAAGTYKIYVFGYNGVSNSSICYSLNAGATALSCTDIYEANNSTSTAKLISANGTINALISSSTDLDWFKFSNTTANKNIKVSLSNLVADYDLNLYRGATIVGTSTNGGTVSEQIILNTTIVGQYKVRVIGYNGVFNSTNCYSLTTQISSIAFTPGLGSIAIEDLPNGAGTLGAYPNPAKNVIQFYIPASETSPTSVSVFDQLGRQVERFEQSPSNVDNNVVFDVNDFASGIYFIKMVQGEISITQKQIIEH